MLLAIDVGNTETVLGLFESGERPDAATGRLVEHWRVATDGDRSADELAVLIDQLLRLRHYEPSETITGIAVASVVPRLRAGLREVTERWFPVKSLVVEPGIKTGMPILYDNPREVGADRIADAVAAYERYGGPTLVVDFGTATTFEAVSARGEYLGGVIVPGIQISLDALGARAAALPRVELLEPRHIIGKNTVESIQAGTIYGFAAQADGLCERFEEVLGPCTVVATGGLAGLIAHHSRRIDHHEPWLTLEGLRIIYDRNADPGRLD